MNFRLMTIFCEVVEKGVMARAAEALGMTAAAVTKAVADLEEDLGTRLLHRTTRKMQVTEDGIHYYETSRFLLNQAKDLHQQLSNKRNQIRGRLRISVPVSFGISQMSEMLKRFSKLYPLVELDIHLEDREIDLIKEGFDLAVRIRRTMRDSSLIARPFGEFQILPVATKNFVSKQGPIKKPADLRNLSFLSYSLSTELNRLTFVSPQERVTLNLKPSIQVNNSIILKQLVLMDHGFGAFPDFLIREELQKGKLEHLLPKFSIGSAKGWMIYPSRKFTPAPVKAFADFFLKEFK